MKPPAPTDIVKARVNAQLTQTQAAALVQYSLRTWQNWESGETKMRPAIWETFKSKVTK
jgi:DNA-binding transcriptional regulator YiaG